MAPLTWTPELAADFESRGDLRDIVVVGADAESWPAIHNLLIHWSPPVVFTLDDEVRRLPESTAAIRELGLNGASRIALQAGKIDLRCHIFAEDDFEFTLDPREVTDGEALEDVSQFMCKLMSATGKPVILTEESWHTAVILRIDPGDHEVHWVPPQRES